MYSHWFNVDDKWYLKKMLRTAEIEMKTKLKELEQHENIANDKNMEESKIEKKYWSDHVYMDQYYADILVKNENIVKRYT